MTLVFDVIVDVGIELVAGKPTYDKKVYSTNDQNLIIPNKKFYKKPKKN